MNDFVKFSYFCLSQRHLIACNLINLDTDSLNIFLTIAFSEQVCKEKHCKSDDSQCLYKVDATGFEPAASASRIMRMQCYTVPFSFILCYLVTFSPVSLVFL